MTQTTTIPDRPEAITAEWLTEAFASSVPGATVTKVEVLDQHTGTTGRMRVGPEYAAGPQGPASVFIKLPPFDEEQREMVAHADMGRKEARFYAGPAAETPVLIPKPYYSAAGEKPTEYIMVLEDLVAAGATFANRTLDAHAEAHAGQLIESLAAHHAHFWNDPRFDSEWSWLPRASRSKFSSEIVAGAEDMFADQYPPLYRELTDLWVNHRDAVVDLWDDGPKTLIHGDTHNGNQLVLNGVAGLYDWGVISKAPGIRDVAIYLGHSCPTELRRENADRWLRNYHRILVDSGVEAPSFDELWLRYRMVSMYPWVQTVTTAAFGDRMQPVDISKRAMDLATTTCADLDTVGAIRDAL